MDVTDILRDRMREPVGFQRMAVVSAIAHVIVIAVALFMPGDWFGATQPEARSVMTISLGGSSGPSTGGMTQIGGRPVQEVAPKEAPPRPEPVRPPAAKPPEMTLPERGAPRRQTTPAPRVTQAPEGATGRTPTRGAETQAGSAIAQTGAQGQGTGLSQGGGGGDGMQLDVANFCCPGYLQELNDRIRSNWNYRLGMNGKVTVRFTIERDGRLTDASVVTPSYQMLNDSALRAVVLTKQTRPLPLEFPNPTLGIRLTFEYER